MTVRLTARAGLELKEAQRWIGGEKDNPAAGMVRWDINKQCLQVYTGSTWADYFQDYELTVTPDFNVIANWVRNKMREEEDLKKKLEKYPGLRDAWEQFKTLEALAHEEDQFGSR